MLADWTDFSASDHVSESVPASAVSFTAPVAGVVPPQPNAHDYSLDLDFIAATVSTPATHTAVSAYEEFDLLFDKPSTAPTVHPVTTVTPTPSLSPAELYLSKLPDWSYLFV